jgi:hypothetical protein
MAELEKKLQASDDKVQTLASKLEVAETEATAVDMIIFRKICYYLNFHPRCIFPKLVSGD